jgi:hypothetical protein
MMCVCGRLERRQFNKSYQYRFSSNRWKVISLLKTEPFKTNINVNYTYIFSPYRAVNPLLLGFKNQPVNAV